MEASAVDQRWQEFVRTEQVIVRTSTLKATLASIGLALLSLLAAGMSYDAFQKEGNGSIKAWGCAVVAPLILIGAAAVLGPVLRRRELAVTREGLAVSSRHRGVRTHQLGLRWEEIEEIAIHRHHSEGYTTVYVRAFLAPGAQAGRGEVWNQRRFLDLPDGFTLSKKELALLLERVRLSQR